MFKQLNILSAKQPSAKTKTKHKGSHSRLTFSKHEKKVPFYALYTSIYYHIMTHMARCKIYLLHNLTSAHINSPSIMFIAEI